MTTLPKLKVRKLGPWSETDTPDIGERYVVEKMLGKQPNLAHPEVQVPPKKIKPANVIVPAPAPVELPSMAAYVRKYGTVDGMKRKKAGLPL
jgi:hypothetical protein